MIKIFLVEDHQIVRYGIKALLEANSQYMVVGESDNSEDLLSQVKNIQVDLVISDISMEGMNGIELTKKLKKEF
ncbi:MAG: response regulator, partial [Bacteroidia bacterium]